MKIRQYKAIYRLASGIIIGIECMSPGITHKVKFSYIQDGIQSMTHTAKLRRDEEGREYFNSYKMTYYVDRFLRVEKAGD